MMRTPKTPRRTALICSLKACAATGVVLAGLAVTTLSSAAEADQTAATAQTRAATAADAAVWPHAASSIHKTAAMERKIARIVAAMTLRQKIGQMTQAEIKYATPDDVRRYYLGSVLNGGGSWPHMDKHTTAADWLALSDAYYDAAMASDAADKIPPLWGTDAVHGHNNVSGATLFPHNIGLGAAHDTPLIGRIGASVGRAVRATGVNWAFAPTVAVVQDERWGRAYEGFSSDPKQVRAYGKAFVQGLQGDFSKDANTIASVKHYMGDGGTQNGKNEGLNTSSQADMIHIHGQGYYGALEAGAQTVMASYNSWTDASAGVVYGKMHGSHVMLTDVLKDRMGFDGFVISDWDAVQQVPGCTKSHCPQAINAGIDMVMVPMDWRDFIDNTVKDVETGVIPLSRIDDAVSRILRVKLRAKLFGRRPSANVYAGKAQAMLDRALARRAVRESLVLLKNNGSVLPLKPGVKVLVVGKSADNLPNQAGGWTITWQGDATTNADFRNAESVLSAIRAANGAGQVVYSATGQGVDPSTFDVIIAVVGETPYAETAGDIPLTSSLSHSARYPEDLAVLKAVSGKGKPVITLFESGRTAYANDLINLSDAFVATWLPGSEGGGVADLVFAKKGVRQGKPAIDFRGRLSFDWPMPPAREPRPPCFTRAMA